MPDRELNLGLFNIIFVGALYEHKGADLLPTIFSSFHHSCPNSHLTIVGGGTLEPFLIAEFTARGLNNYVTFTGVISNLEVRKYYGNSDVLLFPTQVEGFGLVIAEAMMDGTVPLTTLLPGITDAIVESGFTGLLVEKNNINEFVHSLKRLYNSRSLLNQMSRAAMKVARERFDVEIMGENYLKMLNSI
jgi:glycosyltransferase involved in cell wall biosynthesis